MVRRREAPSRTMRPQRGLVLRDAANRPLLRTRREPIDAARRLGYAQRMKYKPFGTGGPAVSVIGQGTWYLDHGDRASAIAALRRGIDFGMTHIDTAEMYGDAELVIAD